MPQTPADPSKTGVNGAKQAARRARSTALIGMLLVSILIGGIAVSLFYAAQTRVLERHLIGTSELQVRMIAGELDRLRNIAAQVSSRTHIRQRLERFNQRQIDRDSLSSFTTPILAEAMRAHPDIVGITRLSRDGETLVEVGAFIDPLLWPSKIAPSRSDVGAPLDGHLVVSAPIRSPSQQWVGTDLVLFRDERLRDLIDESLGHIEANGGIRLAALVRGQARVLYETGALRPELDHEALKSQLIEYLHLGVNEPLHAIDAESHPGLLALHRQVESLPWLFVYYTEPSTFFRSAREQAIFAVLVIMALAVVSILLMDRVARSLLVTLKVEIRKWQCLLRDKQTLLDKVEANEARIRAAVDNAPAAVYIKDGRGRYEHANQTMLDLLALSREDIVGRFDYELFPEDIAKSIHDVDHKVFTTGNALVVDERLPVHGEIRDFLSNKFPLRDARGDIYAVCGIASDITDRKEAERSLALTQTTVDRANVGVIWADADQRVLYLNDTAIKALGIESDPRQLRVADIAPTLGGERWGEHWNSIAAMGSLHFETRFRRGKESTFPVEVYASHLQHEGQAFYIATVHDISDRLEAERMLRQSAAVFQCADEGIILADANGVILDCNDAFQRLLGYPREEVVGRTPGTWRSDQQSAAFYQEMWRSILENGEWRGEVVNRAKDGGLVPTLLAISTVHNELNEVSSYVAIYTDLRKADQGGEMKDGGSIV